MTNKKIVLTVFILVAVIQLAVPGKMIWDREQILDTGKEFKFETAPVDPTDPFRGKYINLQFKENSAIVENGGNWHAGEEIYIILKTNKTGFATVDGVSKEKPGDGKDYLKAKVDYVPGDRIKTIIISYPFDRFYMEESKAYSAEQAYLKSQLDSTKTTYALVSIKNGDAVLKDVMINGVSIGKIVEDYKE